MGLDKKLYVHDPEGELTHVVAPFTALTRPAQDKETNVEEVGDSALILVTGVEIIPSFMHEVMVTGPTQSRGGSPGVGLHLLGEAKIDFPIYEHLKIWYDRPRIRSPCDVISDR